VSVYLELAERWCSFRRSLRGGIPEGPLGGAIEKPPLSFSLIQRYEKAEERGPEGCIPRTIPMNDWTLS